MITGPREKAPSKPECLKLPRKFRSEIKRNGKSRWRPAMRDRLKEIVGDERDRRAESRKKPGRRGIGAAALKDTTRVKPRSPPAPDAERRPSRSAIVQHSEKKGGTWAGRPANRRYR